MLYVIGDLHGGYDRSMKYLNTKNFKEQKNLTKDDTLVQLGDFGFLWSYERTKEEDYWFNWLADKNFSTLVILGNHENYDLVEKLPIINKFNGRVRELKLKKNSIYFGITGEIYNIDGYNILCINGAESTDKQYRIIGETWWEQEKITQKEIDYTLDNLNKFYNEGKSIDYIFSHTMPSKFMDKFIPKKSYALGKFNCKNALFLDYIWDNYTPNIGLHCGHLHKEYYIIDNERIIHTHYLSKPYNIKEN